MTIQVYKVLSKNKRKSRRSNGRLYRALSVFLNRESHMDQQHD